MKHWIIVGLLGLSLPVTAAADPAQDRATEKATEAYNAGRYNDAARQFLKLVQASPTDAELYRSLARARVWASEPGGAIVAYRFYLALAPADAADREKIESELQLAERKAGKSPPAGPPPGPARTLAAAEVRAKSGLFAGADGAFGAIKAAVEGGYIGPELAKVRTQVRKLLRARSEDALTAWWRPEQIVRAKTLTALAAGWAEAGQDVKVSPAETPAVRALDALARLQGGDAAGALEVLAEVAPGDPRLRYAQAIALFQTEQYEQAAQVLSTLGEQVEDRRVSILAAMTATRLGEPNAAASLRQALLE